MKRIGKGKDYNNDNMKEAFTRRFNSAPYKVQYRIWKNPDNPNSKADAKVKMTALMLKTYNHHKAIARTSIINEFNLLQRAQALEGRFGSKQQ